MLQIPLINLLQLQYPGIVIGINGQVVLSDYGTGEGPFISSWNVPGVKQPSTNDLATFQASPNIQAGYQALLNTWQNAPIIAQLDAIDTQSIRTLREPDPTYLTALTAKAVALRAQLLPMTAAGVIAAQGAS